MYFHDLTLILVAVIAASPGFLAWMQSKKNKDGLKEVKVAVHEVKLTVNGRMDELLKSSKAESKAQGVEEGKAEQKGENDSRTKT